MTGERLGVIRPQIGRQLPDLHGTMPGVTDLSPLGWTPDREPELPPGTAAARVARIDRGLLTVLAAAAGRRVHPASSLHDESGAGSPAVGDWVALRGELAVAVLPRRSAFRRT